MNVRILFFGAVADIVGDRELTLACADRDTAGDVLRSLLTDFPLLQAHKLLCSVNQEYARGSEIVREGDEVAIFTPVSGG